MTIEADGSRAALPSVRSANEIWTIGCSFTEGSTFINDADTYPAQLQELSVESRVRNFGVSAYGTTQTFLLLKRLIEQIPSAPSAVVYGFVDFHIPRTIAYPAWLKGLQEHSIFPVMLPGASLSATGVSIKRPSGYPFMSAAAHSSLLTLLVDSSLALESSRNEEHSLIITARLIQKMKDLVEGRGSKFLPVMLDSVNAPKAFYLKSFTAQGISLIDCVPPIPSPERKFVPTTFTPMRS